MSQLWISDESGVCSGHPIDGRLHALGPRGTRAIGPEQLGAAGAPLLACGDDGSGRERWTLLCAPGQRVRVNGEPVAIGIRALCDRDAIAFESEHGRARVFLSLEGLAEIVAFPASDRESCCIRCKLPIEPGAPAVRCPDHDCRAWHHQAPEQPCWTYTEHCASCGHPTAFDAGFQWSPDAL